MTFEYLTKINNKWELVNKFDSFTIPYGFQSDHTDFNGDKIKDFAFIADQGGRGSNYYDHLFLFDSAKKSFSIIKGFEHICAPQYDPEEKNIVGIGLSGSDKDIRTYSILKDSIIQKEGEVWEGPTLIRKYKIVDGKEIVVFQKKEQQNN